MKRVMFSKQTQKNQGHIKYQIYLDFDSWKIHAPLNWYAEEQLKLIYNGHSKFTNEALP